jgi:hypothetical protein
VLLGVALYCIRAAFVDGDGEWAIAFGLALLETVCVIGAEVLAHGLRRDWQHFRQALRPHEATRQLVVCAEREVEAAQGELDACRGRREAHLRRVRLREHVARTVPLLRRSLAAAAELGLRTGEAENVGHLDGSDLYPPGEQSVLRGRGHGAPAGAAPAPWRRRNGEGTR